MSTDRDITRVVRSWLENGSTALPQRVLDGVLDQIPSTPQRRPRLAWRTPSMNRLGAVVYLAAAAAVVAVAGILLTAIGGVGGPSSSSSALPFATPGSVPGPTPWAINGQRGDLLPGRYSLFVQDIPMTFTITAPGWEPGPIRQVSSQPTFQHGDLLVSKSSVGPQGAEAVVFWTTFPDGTTAQLCGHLLAQPVGSSADDLATAVAAAPGTELMTAPSDATVGRRPAKHVVLTVRAELGCDPGFFYRWPDEQWGAFWSQTQVGDTIQVWIVDIDGTLLFIEAETKPNVGATVEKQVQQIVGSIQFE
jgi:hypothetical protein